ncbi:glycine betaine ABC transporter substrate-binding protein [Pelotalea chapellei]|uniref:ABC-type glycine betaine transport system substrate-binding domain-containing protein n=1 Tax=Pelotalea chapellei TaxID=44671 RepID=A0ABS5UA17_9BACT|nr:glycine betaine ABC transporter substrate-binding protein [Pelotalea chapellei]MBT1072514.1 hypothetical protein [Pelotalea chapellei]
MKKVVIWCIALCAVAIVSIANISSACVGKTIHLGVVTSNERLLAEMASLLISERTGSSVKVEVFKNSKELYNAARQGALNVIIESPSHGAEVVGKAKDSTYEQVKSEYKSRLNMIWLDPIGGGVKYAPVLTSETLSNYPALPKLLNKLSSALANDTYAKLLKSAETDDKTKKVAKEFLKGKKLI